MSKKKVVSLNTGMKKPDYKSIKSDSKTFIQDFRYAMHYVHYEYTAKKLREETVKLAKKRGFPSKNLEQHDNYFFQVLGKPCVILNLGGEVPDEWATYVESEIKKLDEEGKKIKKEKDKQRNETESKDVVSIQDRIRFQAQTAASEIDEIIDDFISNPAKFKVPSDIYGKMVSLDVKGAQARYIKAFYSFSKEEIALALDSDDEDIKEAYSTYTKSQLKKIHSLYIEVEKACDMLVDKSKVKRVKKKTVPLDKQVSNLKFQKEDKDIGLVSINPVDIIGALELWAFNTKTRKLARYLSADSNGLAVKGTTIVNYSDASIEKTLRKPKEQLSEFKGLTKRSQQKFLDSIKTVDTKLRGRIQETHILLKVFR